MKATTLDYKKMKKKEDAYFLDFIAIIAAISQENKISKLRILHL
jgi:hypothetical protein